ncbi:coiled-coil domain-containing protein 62 isoform X2 [Alosa alosa]|uniref:coiled-coil domain-containing protein 62 isoform X2 n=1 Tax=Alosa alosa TaxID=278164 RepID=UPI00201546B9|nr:coiled-coil domain-containing protein 62 isoform X2 [Alosa alosa]
MNQERRCMKQADSSRRSSLQSSDFPAEPWHSTPVKKHQDARPDAVASGRDRMVKQENGPFQRRLPLSTSLPLTQDCQTAVCDLEYSTLQRQRRELQLLMAELKDRDQELNNMAATHHTQLLAWQQDRQRVLLLEERCARLEEELKQQHEVLRAVGRRVQTAEAQEKSSQRELSAAQQQLQDLQHTQRHSSQLQQELEDRNHALNSTITLLSSQVGQLQAREEELSAMLKLKDKDVTEAIAHIQDLSSRLRMQEDSQRELRTRESKIFAELEEVKRLYREVRHENTRLKDELEEKTLENSTQREEVIRLKQETQLLRRDLLISGEGESWKDEMLELSRSKQERTEVELRCLRQVCANQQNDLQLLKLNLESTQETLKVQRSHGSGIGYAAVESSFQRSGTEAGPTYYQHRAIEPPEELRRGGRTPMLERERQDAIHQPADSSGSSQTPLNGDSVVWLQAGVSTSEPRGGSSTAEPVGGLSVEHPKPGVLATEPVDAVVLGQPIVPCTSTMSQPVAALSTAQPVAIHSISQPVPTSATNQPVATISTANAVGTSSTGHSTAAILTDQSITTSFPSQDEPSITTTGQPIPPNLIGQSADMISTVQPVAQPVVTASTTHSVASISKAHLVVTASTTHSVASISKAQPLVTASTAQLVASISKAQSVASISTTYPVASISKAHPVATASTAQPVSQPVSTATTMQPVASISTAQPVVTVSTCQSIANSSWSQPEITISTCQQPVATISIAKSTATTSTSHPAATTSTSQHMATIPVVQAQPIDTMSTGQLIGEALSGVTSSSGPPCPPEAQPSCSSTSARPPAIVNEQSPASRHSEVTEVSGDVYSVAQEELPRDTPVVCGGAEEQQKDEPGVGVATDRYEEQRGKPEMEEEEEKKVEEQDMKRETSGEEEEKVKKMKEGVERGTLWEEEEEGLEVEVAVMLDVDSESEYSVQMVEVDPLTLDLNLNPETDQVCRVCQGEATCSPQPASPVLWTSVNPGGSPRAIYLSSPTTPKQGFQEAECTSTHRLQRLLEESRQMVATLEGLSLEPKSPSPRPAHAHTPSPSHHPSHSPSPNHASAGNLNGCYDYSSSQHSSSEVHSQNSSGHSSTLIRKIHHLTKNSPSKPGGDTSQ